jgi:hypothetical protein
MFELQSPVPTPAIFEVISTEGSTRFFLQPDLESMQAMLEQYPAMMGPGVASQSTVQAIEGSRERQFDYVMSHVPEWFRKHWCSGGLCGCMGCANRSGGMASLGFTKDDWLAWKSRQIRFIGIPVQSAL